ncbi:MAG: hypothetical protein IJS15_10710 [Victivallales bacterium]|nr:hypothetical protein [Victivallales bacterium]
MESIILIDAYSQIFRLFYALPMLNNSRGEPVNALMGITRLLLTLDKTMPSAYGAVAFDKGRPPQRMELCPEYKANRPQMPQELRSQIPAIERTFELFGWNVLIQEGLEADDIIAAVARRRGESDVLILTSDKDISQLTADPHVRMLTPLKGDAWDIKGAEGVTAKFGVSPELLGDYLALVGDSSDNINGVPGVGPKTAANILNTYGPLDGILDDINAAVKEPKIAAKLCDNCELIRRNQQLVKLGDQTPDSWHGLESIIRSAPDWDSILEFAEDNSFKSIIPTIRKRREDSAQPSFF